ncbi:hypothetical protein DFH27DRAFT_521691 [Peziza echinospora]|nr:hypothetical protein DFH27DRAFT_521691 [Peziza echinospora]
MCSLGAQSQLSESNSFGLPCSTFGLTTGLDLLTVVANSSVLHSLPKWTHTVCSALIRSRLRPLAPPPLEHSTTTPTVAKISPIQSKRELPEARASVDSASAIKIEQDSVFFGYSDDPEFPQPSRPNSPILQNPTPHPSPPHIPAVAPERVPGPDEGCRGMEVLINFMGNGHMILQNARHNVHIPSDEERAQLEMNMEADTKMHEEENRQEEQNDSQEHTQENSNTSSRHDNKDIANGSGGDAEGVNTGGLNGSAGPSGGSGGSGGDEEDRKPKQPLNTGDPMEIDPPIEVKEEQENDAEKEKRPEMSSPDRTYLSNLASAVMGTDEATIGKGAASGLLALHQSTSISQSPHAIPTDHKPTDTFSQPKPSPPNGYIPVSAIIPHSPIQNAHSPIQNGHNAGLAASTLPVIVEEIPPLRPTLPGVTSIHQLAEIAISQSPYVETHSRKPLHHMPNRERSQLNMSPPSYTHPSTPLSYSSYSSSSTPAYSSGTEDMRINGPSPGSHSAYAMSPQYAQGRELPYLHSSTPSSGTSPYGGIRRGSSANLFATPGYDDPGTSDTIPDESMMSAHPSPKTTRGRGSIDGSPAGTFRCEHPGCNSAPFQTQYLLNSHANVHSAARPHFCPVPGCSRGEKGRGFKRKNEMIRHGLVHESPGYVCPFCPDREHKYPRPDNLQRHVRVHHTDKSKEDPLLREVLSQRPEGGNRGRRRRMGAA